MSYFFQAASGAVLACILCVALGKQGMEFRILITVAVSGMILLLSVSFLEPVLEFIHRLETLGNLDPQMISILFKAVGIGLLSDITALICNDSGNNSVGKALQTLGTVVILWLAIPIFNALLDLIQQLLGEI